MPSGKRDERDEHAPLRWRRGRDLNPRQSFWPCDGLANRCLRPLGHLSVNRKSITYSLWLPLSSNNDERKALNCDLTEKLAIILGLLVNLKLFKPESQPL